MTLRGIKAAGSTTQTMAFRGGLTEEPAKGYVVAQFLH
jgi:GTP cyclohydrolase I